MPGSIFDVKDYGAVGDGVADDTAAFKRALDAIAALSKVARPGFPNSSHIEVVDPSGAMLWVPRGQYRLNRTLRLNRQTVLQGVGAGASVLRFLADIDGVVVDSTYSSAPEADTVAVNGTPLPHGHGSGAGSVIRDIGIIGGSSFGRSNPPRPAVNEDDPLTPLPLSHSGHPIRTGCGVVLCGVAVVENCSIQGFHYDGVHIETIDTIGDLVRETGEPYTGPSSGKNSTTKSANGWQVRNCFIYGNGRHGIFTAGGNSNGGIALGGTLMNNAGWAVYDRSQHGNTYLGCIAEANGHFSTNVLVLFADASNPGALFAGTADAGAFKSGNNAQSWAAINLGLLDFELLPRVQALLIEPRGPRNTLYVGTNGGRLVDSTNPNPQNPFNRVVLQSKDEGASWFDAGTSRNGLTSSDVRALVVHVPTTGTNTLFAGTADAGVFKGTITPAANPMAPDTIAWAAVNTGLTNRVVQALAIVPATTPATLYAGTRAGVFKTSDAGAHWSPTGLQTGDVQALVIHPTNPNTLYVATRDAGVFKTTDGGTTWQAANTGLVDGGPVTDLRALVIDRSSPAVLYVGTNGHGVFKTTDGAGTWSRLPGSNTLSSPAPIVQALAINSADPSIIYAGTNVGLFTCTQSNGQWTPYQPFYGGSYKTTQTSASANVFVGCYAEGDQVYGGELVYPTLMLGGVNGGGFNFTTNAGLVVTTSGSGQGVIGLPIRSPVLSRVRTVRGSGPNTPIPIDAVDCVIFADATSQDVRLQLPRISPGNNNIPGQQFTIKRIDNNPNRIVVWRAPDAPVDGQVSNTDFFLVPTANIDYVNKKFSSITLVADNGDWKVVNRA